MYLKISNKTNADGIPEIAQNPTKNELEVAEKTPLRKATDNVVTALLAFKHDFDSGELKFSVYRSDGKASVKLTEASRTINDSANSVEGIDYSTEEATTYKVSKRVSEGLQKAISKIEQKNIYRQTDVSSTLRLHETNLKDAMGRYRSVSGAETLLEHFV